jgi:endoglucanase
VNLGLRLLPILCLPILACSGGPAASNNQPAQSQAPAMKAPGMSNTVAFDAHLLIDQFGYRPGDAKVAVLRNPQIGYDHAEKFSPGSKYQVRRTEDGGVVFSGAPTVWRGGAVESSSGDNGWWFDFSAVTTPGSYFIFDAERNVRSAPFVIDQQVYKNILKAAMRMYYYQRSGAAKQRPYADACWVDEPAYIGPDQDLEAHDITDRDNKSKFKNVSGGWFDAGDTNKYVTYAAQPVHQLLTAYQENPGVFTDDFNIPESGNGVPDVLDEVKWETDWLKRMQYADGSAALKVGEIVYAAAAPPSSDRNTRYYIPSCTSSTIAVAGMFAHAAYVFANIPALGNEATDLKARAVAAWNNYQGIAPKQTHCDTGVVHAGNADWADDVQSAEAVTAAIYLYAITDNADYHGYVRAHFRDTKPYHDIGWSRYSPEQGEALLFYTTLPHADPAVRGAILADKLNDARSGNQIYGFHPEDDLYRAYLHDAQYHWGSNNPRAGYGNTNIDMITYNIVSGDAADYRTRALETLHYFHGVNPFAMAYLSNMRGYGATRSVNEIYHTWFAHGTQWSDALASECGPAPGYVPGGPNARASNDVPSSLTPPAGQPPQKSYKDWNVGSPENSWAITEPAIYYQSGYVKLLSKFSQ